VTQFESSLLYKGAPSTTLLEVYQQADEASVLAVTSETRQLRERGVA
jgi:hypothetical protein